MKVFSIWSRSVANVSFVIPTVVELAVIKGQAWNIVQSLGHEVSCASYI